MGWYAMVGDDGRLQSEPEAFPWPGWAPVPGPLPDGGWWDVAEWRLEGGGLVHDPDGRHEGNAVLMEQATEFEARAFEVSCEVDAALCETYEALIAEQAVVADQDAAICELYEMMIGESA